MINRCKGCTDRHVGCHSTCQHYIQFRKELDEVNEKMRLDRISKSFRSYVTFARTVRPKNYESFTES